MFNKLMIPALMLVGCSQSDNGLSSAWKNPETRDSRVNALLNPSWVSFSGELVKGNNGFCNATYIGDGREFRQARVEGVAGSFLPVSLVAESGDNETLPSYLVLTAFHCIKDFVSSIDQISVRWANGKGVTKVSSVLVAGDPSKAFYDDVAILALDKQPEGVSVFRPNLASKRGFSSVTVKAPVPSNDITKRLTILGMRDGKTITPSCDVASIREREKGFTLECQSFDVDAEGVSGALVINSSGEPVGVFKGTLPGEKNYYGAHAIAWGALRGGLWEGAISAASVKDSAAIFSATISCKGSISSACLGSKTPSKATVNAAFMNANNGLQKLLTCTTKWGKTKPSGSSATNGEICKFSYEASGSGKIDYRQQPLYDRLVAIFGKDDLRKCSVKAEGQECNEGAGCLFSEGATTGQCRDPNAAPATDSLSNETSKGGCYECVTAEVFGAE